MLQAHKGQIEAMDKLDGVEEAHDAGERWERSVISFFTKYGGNGVQDAGREGCGHAELLLDG